MKRRQIEGYWDKLTTERCLKILVAQWFIYIERGCSKDNVHTINPRCRLKALAVLHRLFYKAKTSSHD